MAIKISIDFIGELFHHCSDVDKQERREKAIELLKAGFTPIEIRMTEPQIDGSLITRVRIELGLPPFKRGVIKGTANPLHGVARGNSLLVVRNKAIAREMKVAGYTYDEIGKSLGISHQRAQQYLRVIPSVKAIYCSRCGEIGKPIHYHHTNYATGEVVPLCPSCHTIITKGAAFERFKAAFGNRHVVTHEEVICAMPCSTSSLRKWCKKLGIIVAKNKQGRKYSKST